MNNLKKEAAVKRHLPLAQSGATTEEVTKALKADSKKFTKEEIDEIMPALMEAVAGNDQPGDTGGSASGEPLLPPDHNEPGDAEKAEYDKIQKEMEEARLAKPINRAGTIMQFTRYKMEPKFRRSFINGGWHNELTGYQRKGEALQITNIEQKHAEILNAQTPNSMEYYFAAGEEEFVPIEKIIPPPPDIL